VLIEHVNVMSESESHHRVPSFGGGSFACCCAADPEEGACVPSFGGGVRPVFRHSGSFTPGRKMLPEGGSSVIEIIITALFVLGCCYFYTFLR
jgi:hypothetical protein